MMKRTTLFWILAAVITIVSAYYQRVTGPTYALTGSTDLAGERVSYRFERNQTGEVNHLVRLNVMDLKTSGVLEWKRHKTNDYWTPVPMSFSDGVLQGELPAQPPAGKLEYFVRLRHGRDSAIVPASGPVVIRFKGEVPLWILIPHVIGMFLAMLLSTRAGFEVFNPEPDFKRLTLWALALLTLGGMILGPIVQKFAFGEFWTGIPFGTDLTDNKTMIAFVAWIAATVAVHKSKKPQAWILAAAIVMFVIFIIPHSMFGSELDYSTLPNPE